LDWVWERLRALAEARDRGIDPLEEEPRTGVQGTRIAFLPAESASGALIELVEKGLTAKSSVT
jgi:hypothetical protein